MIETKACVVVRCDGCRELAENGQDYIPHFDDAEEARERTEDFGMWSNGTVDLCYSCARKPHPFVPCADPEEGPHCRRCEQMPSESRHDPAAPVVPVRTQPTVRS